jgi:high-affinity Fe2+/Pb2+ permease
MKPFSRVVTLLAVACLALDALLLLYSGLSLGRAVLVVGGVACGIAAVLVVLGWRRYRRALAELEQAQREMRVEVESIRALLHSRHSSS